MRRAYLFTFLILSYAIAGCAGDTGPNISGLDGVDIKRVEIAPAFDSIAIADTLRPGDLRQMRAVAISRVESPIPNLRFVWTSSDQSVAVVDSTGLVTPKGYGTVRITASAYRQATATLVIVPATRTVTIAPSVDTIFVDDPMAPRDTIHLRAIARDEKGQPVTGVHFTWSVNNGMTSVDGSGLVRARTLGWATVTARTTDRGGFATVAVMPVVKAVTVSSPTLRVLRGDTLQLTASALGYDDRPMAGRVFTWSSSQPNVATVSSTGRVLFVGTGTTTITATSAFVSNSVTVTALPRLLQAIDAGNEFACGFAPLGRGYCWGRGDVGQLATPTDSLCFAEGATAGRVGCSISPKRFAGPDLEFTTVSAGGTFGCGVTSANLLYCWGSDALGQMGNGGKGGGPVPSLATVAQERFTTVSAGSQHACALNLAGNAYCWGDDRSGQLGDRRVVFSTTPIPVIGGLQFSTISAGGQHTCGITTAGAAVCWGSNDVGQLGIGTVGGTSDVPVAVGGGLSFTGISSGENHTCAVTAGGQAYCWGLNVDGRVGSGATGDTVRSPALVAGGLSHSRISAGANHTCSVTSGSRAFCWGSNFDSQLGNGSFGGLAAAPVAVSTSLSFTSVTAGWRTSCAVATDGESYCWGSNVLGALGNELQAAFRATPQKVATPR